MLTFKIILTVLLTLTSTPANEGRPCGIEREAEYVEIARQRIAAEAAKAR